MPWPSSCPLLAQCGSCTGNLKPSPCRHISTRTRCSTQERNLGPWSATNKVHSLSEAGVKFGNGQLGLQEGTAAFGTPLSLLASALAEMLRVHGVSVQVQASLTAKAHRKYA